MYQGAEVFLLCSWSCLLCTCNFPLGTAETASAEEQQTGALAFLHLLCFASALSPCSVCCLQRLMDTRSLQPRARLKGLGEQRAEYTSPRRSCSPLKSPQRAIFGCMTTVLMQATPEGAVAFLNATLPVSSRPYSALLYS